MIDVKRILNDIENIAGIKNQEYPFGCTRHSYSKEDKAAREYLHEEMSKLGLGIKTDGMGNIRASLPGKDPSLAPVLVGSHIDTVTSGGKYDGLVGVLSALECIRVIKENNLEHKRSVELIIFAEEEGSNFGITMLGSKALVGKLTTESLHKIKNDRGQSAYEVIKEAGYNPDLLGENIIKKDDVHAMIESHIEQGGRLNSIGKPIGVVRKIAGMETYKVTFKGVSNHAGSTLMHDRRDPMLAAADIIRAMNDAANKEETAVATVGKMLVSPNSSNAIAGEASAFVDIRDVKEGGIGKLNKTLHKTAYAAAKKYGLSVDIDLLAKSEIVKLSDKVISIIEGAAEKCSIDYHKMNSGAVHDSVMLAEVTDVGMIFVPSVEGKSHCPDEFTKENDIKVGAELMLEVIKEVSNE